ncbi:EamA family transporter [Halovibrio salipaludis]|uniref:EamA family transporter n=2 Tax=Halovibrio salipaludis TaxID=2032626 RepID=A0A2A2F9S1_9GAMM|nr:EamA family transporter [Halovibrio salipaludis]
MPLRQPLFQAGRKEQVLVGRIRAERRSHRASCKRRISGYYARRRFLPRRLLGGMFLGGGKVSPGLATVLANTQPLIAAALAMVFLSERFTPRIGTGLFLGFAGVVVMSLPSLSGPNPLASTEGLLWITLGAVGTAAGNVLLKIWAGRADVLMVTGLQLLIGAVALAASAQVFGEGREIAWTFQFLVSLGGLAVFGTALVSALWYHLLSRASLNRLNTFNFLTPAFGLLMGGLFFEERLGLIQTIGILITLLSIQLVATNPSRPEEHGW